MSKINSLRDLFDEQIRVLHSAEKKIQQKMPRIMEKVSSRNLKSELEDLIDLQEMHLTRLEQVFKNLSLSLSKKSCAAMDGIIDEINTILEEDTDDMVMDAAIIAETQKAMHFKIACYGTLRTYAEVLDFNNVANEMQIILNELKEADKTLTRIAQTINIKAMH
jgi:ferritin-like metal-binding protein YciE